MSDTHTLHRGHRPLLVSVPHAGTAIPADIAEALVPRARAVEDADWHLDRLYDFAVDIGASFLVPRHARYVVDLNRPPEDTPMYPGLNNTGLCPTRFFTGEPLYREGREPDAAEVRRRVERYWRPYHGALAGELDRLKAAHGHALLLDGHSIQAELPWLFDGRLPDLSLGSADGAACAPGLRDHAAAVLAAQTRFSHVVDGRFKGGYITRRYGRPHEGVHALQMEMCWPCYLRDAADPAGGWNEAAAADARALLKRLAEAMLGWRA